jgi:hypothetical protein
MSDTYRQQQKQGSAPGVGHWRCRVWAGGSSQCKCRSDVGNATLHDRERVEAPNKANVSGKMTALPKRTEVTPNELRPFGFNSDAVNTDRINRQGLSGATVRHIQEQAKLPIVLREVDGLNRDCLSGNGDKKPNGGNESFHAFEQTASSVPAVVLWAIPPDASTKIVRETDSSTVGSGITWGSGVTVGR